MTRLVERLRKVTDVEDWEMSDAELIETFRGTLTFALAELHVAFGELWERIKESFTQNA